MSILFSRRVCEPDLRSACKGQSVSAHQHLEQRVNEQSGRVGSGRSCQVADCRPAAWAVRGQRVMSQGRERAGGWRRDGKGLSGGEEEQLNLTHVQPLLGFYSTTGSDRKTDLQSDIIEH